MSDNNNQVNPKPPRQKWLKVTMPDGTHWNVSVELVAHNRALYYAKSEEITYLLALHETKELFKNNWEVIDWATNNMDWDDVRLTAWKSHEPADEIGYQEGWVNGDHEIWTQN
jgi:hypothetical protein